MDRTFSVAALFPGQGAFDGEALSRAARRYPEIAAVFGEIDEVTAAEAGRSLSDIVLGDAPVSLSELLAEEPWVSQLAIYGTDIAVYRVLRGLGLRPDVLIGHSLGEIAALACAGVYTVADGARVIWQRVRVVADTDLRDGWMAALSADPRRAGAIVDVVGDDDLAVAGENHDGQTVVSGPADAMRTLQSVASAAGVASARLASPAPFHSPVLLPAVRLLAEAIRGVPTGVPETPVYSPILDRQYTEDDDMPTLLARHLVEPVKFAEAMRRTREWGTRWYVECGAGRTLGKFAKRTRGDDEITVVPGLSGDGDGVSAALRTLQDGGLLSSPHTGGTDAPQRRTGFDAFWGERGSDILEHIRREFEDYEGMSALSVPQQGDRAEAPETPPPGSGLPARDELAERLRQLYADALGYPEEVFGDEVELEAELGIDSVKQAELLSRVSQEFGLRQPDDGFPLADYDRMGKIIDYAQRALANGELTHVR